MIEKSGVYEGARMSEAGQPESAIVALIPEAESLVEPFRRRYDPSAAVAMPAHVTILYPFKPPNELGDSVLSALRQLFLSAPSFEVAFPHTARFLTCSILRRNQPSLFAD